jgi:hypothetical protein
LTFPTFDAGVLLAVTLVSNPERYHENFAKPYHCLKNAYERLTFIGSIMPLAKAGSEILQSTLRRVVEAQERAGYKVYDLPSDVNPAEALIPPMPDDIHRAGSTGSSSLSPDAEPWQFEVSQSAMDWTVQNPDFAEFDFSNLEVPMPLKELLLDEEMSIPSGMESYDPSLWMLDQQGMINPSPDQQQAMEIGENSLWNFLTEYPTMSGDPNAL